MFKFLYFLNVLFSQYWTVPGTVKYDFIGNSFNTKDVITGKSLNSTKSLDYKWVQDFTQSMWVSKNGTVYAYSNWDENDRIIGMYKDGDVIGQVDAYTQGFLNWGDIVGDDTYTYSTASVSYGDWTSYGYGVYVSKLNGSPANEPNLIGENNSYISINPSGGGLYMRLAINKTTNKLFVTDSGNKIHVIQTRPFTQNKLETFYLDSVVSMTTDNVSGIWVIRNNKIEKYDDHGNFIKRLNFTYKPTLIRFSRQNELLVWDDSTCQLYFIRNYNNANVTYRTVGIKNSNNILDGTMIDNYLMPGLRGVGTDSLGNLYLGWGYGNNGPTYTQIRKYNKNMNIIWNIYASVFVGVISFDKNLEFAYSSEFKFSCDWSKPVGQKFKPIAFNWDRKTDSSLMFAGHTYIREIKGKRIVIKSARDLYSSGLRLFVEIGNKLIPAMTIYKSETMAWYMDMNGDIWWGDYVYGVVKYKFVGFTKSGIPTWDTINKIVVHREDSGSVTRLIYFEDSDQMLLTMVNPRKYNIGNTGDLGNFMMMYNNYSSSNRSVAWTRDISIDSFPRNYGYLKLYKASIWAEKDYIFVISIGNEPRNLDVYRRSDGLYIGTIYPGPEIGGDVKIGVSYGQLGWIDMMYGLYVVHKNGLYVISIENDLTARNFVYMWCPNNNCLNF